MLEFFKKRTYSFWYALQGIGTLVNTQINAKIHLLAALIVIATALFLGLEKWDFAILIACITLVLAAEAFNTAIEFLTDLVSPDFHPLAKKTKDVAAAAVLVCAIGSVIIGLMVFMPYIIRLI